MKFSGFSEPLKPETGEFEPHLVLSLNERRNWLMVWKRLS